MLKKKMYCPANGWDCPYFNILGECELVTKGYNPIEECDDCSYFYDEEDSPFIWEDEDCNEYDESDLLKMGYHFVNGEPIKPINEETILRSTIK